MAISVNGNGHAEEGGEEEETPAEFEERIYLALMAVARSTSSKTRDQLGACVLLGRPYASASDSVRATIRQFIEEAEL